MMNLFIECPQSSTRTILWLELSHLCSLFSTFSRSAFDRMFARSRRLFGACCKLLYSRQLVLQALLDALESNDQVELYAAIGALERFLSISTVACVRDAADGSGTRCASARDATADTDWPAVHRGVLNSLALFVQRIRSPMHLKLQIVPLFRFFAADAQLSQLVRAFVDAFVCFECLMYSSNKFIMYCTLYRGTRSLFQYILYCVSSSNFDDRLSACCGS